MSTKTFTLIGVVVLVAIGAVIALTSGGDEEAEASDADGAFIVGMVPHHEGAIEMAELAQENAKHAEILQLADDIVADQSEEIDTLEAIHERLFGEPVGAMNHGSMGLNEHMMGMDADMAMLESSRRFDRLFIDMMIPHHQGAIRMAQIELAEGEDAETMALAEDVVAAQSREIEEMNAWREQWYGAPSPAGGIPDADETMGEMGSMPGMEH